MSNYDLGDLSGNIVSQYETLSGIVDSDIFEFVLCAIATSI